MGKRKISDASAVDLIADTLTLAADWASATINEIADIIRLTGRTVESEDSK